MMEIRFRVFILWFVERPNTAIEKSRDASTSDSGYPTPAKLPASADHTPTTPDPPRRLSQNLTGEPSRHILLTPTFTIATLTITYPNDSTTTLPLDLSALPTILHLKP